MGLTEAQKKLKFLKDEFCRLKLQLDMLPNRLGMGVHSCLKDIGKELDQLVLLGPYIGHKDDCAYIEDLGLPDGTKLKGNPCTCGLSDLLSSFESKTK